MSVSVSDEWYPFLSRMIHISEISSYPRSLAQADTLCSSYVHEGDPEAVFLSFAEIHAELENAHLLSSWHMRCLWTGVEWN